MEPCPALAACDIEWVLLTHPWGLELSRMWSCGKSPLRALLSGLMACPMKGLPGTSCGCLPEVTALVSSLRGWTCPSVSTVWKLPDLVTLPTFQPKGNGVILPQVSCFSHRTKTSQSPLALVPLLSHRASSPASALVGQRMRLPQAGLATQLRPTSPQWHRQSTSALPNPY